MKTAADFNFRELRGAGPIGEEIAKLQRAIRALLPVETPTVRAEMPGDGLRLHAKVGAGGTPTEFRRLTVRREGWLALEGEDAQGNLILALKPDAILAYAGIDDATAYPFAGHSLTAERETDTGTWPEAEGFFMVARNRDFPGDDLEYFHEVVWPPYIAEADSVTSGCRLKTSTAPARQTFVAARLRSMASVAIDDVTLDAYDAGSPVGDSVTPQWVDANWDARRWTRWSFISNRLTLDTVTGAFVGGQ